MEERPELMPLLTVAGGAMRGLSFRVGPVRQVIGRVPTADVVVPDAHLSRRHAEVWLTDEGACLVDLGSTNGTWLNDRRITGVERLADGDVIRVGRTELRLFDPGVARTDPVGLSFGQPRRDHRPTLPLPIATPALPGADPLVTPARQAAQPVPPLSAAMPALQGPDAVPPLPVGALGPAPS
ncbi:FHA domain-containing protein [Micromonospora sp. NPDC047730]|uniref:FHA domain-containing protein n=1 Tax=Micromonospora sp. NPDC047730 TaxID=3364253 RepID=UPI00371BB6B8